MITFYEFCKILENKVKDAPQGKRNAECARCGLKDKARLYDINAGKAKCKNCGGYLHLISTESVEAHKCKCKCVSCSENDCKNCDCENCRCEGCECGKK